eukprot:scaffold2551_cov113-Cylindrotheca_fusiformis.AAC.29
MANAGPNTNGSQCKQTPLFLCRCNVECNCLTTLSPLPLHSLYHYCANAMVGQQAYCIRKSNPGDGCLYNDRECED